MMTNKFLFEKKQLFQRLAGIPNWTETNLISKDHEDSRFWCILNT